MAIPAGTKFHGVAPGVDTINKGSSTANANRDAYTIEDIAVYVGSGGIATLEPEFVTATPGGTYNITSIKNIIDISWSGGAGDFTLNLPSATAIPYRFLRIVNDSTVTAAERVNVTATGGQTIDGAANYTVNKAYNGIAVWSDGSNWIVIQAKAT
jgi:hypothetical protein